jgi:uncharacterized protein
MNPKRLFLATSLALAATLFTGCAAHMPGHHRQSVVFQVSDNDPGKWNLALNNARNVQQEFGADQVNVEIVAYGPGIGMLKADSVTANRVTEATKSGVQVVACQNTMKAQKLTEADMNPAIGYVPAGVVELMKRHREGWDYIRP